MVVSKPASSGATLREVFDLPISPSSEEVLQGVLPGLPSHVPHMHPWRVLEPLL